MHRILPSSREWPLHGTARTREIEARALASSSPGALMQGAGAALGKIGLAVAPHAASVWIVAGPGNNGGDGMEAALHFAAAGRVVDVDLLGEPAALPADARAAFERARVTAGITVHLTRGAVPVLGPHDLAVDALLGIGASRPPAGELAAAIRVLNSQSCARLAVDVPSGLDVDTGQPLGDECVRATHTLSLLTLKTGLYTGAGRDHAGVTWLADLGVDTANDPADAWLSASRPAPSVERRHDQNKGSFGDVIIVGGAAGMTGAALLSGRAAHAAGAGRVYLHLLQSGPSTLAHDLLRPELMFRGDDLLADDKQLGKSTVVCGCGGGHGIAAVLPRLLEHAGRLVLDADALNAVAGDPALAQRLVERGARGRPTVVTPHPLEAARLLGVETAQVQADRLQSAATLVERLGSAVVLKGSGSVIAGRDRTPRINASGNASLASAGTGDVLAGWLGGLWAQNGKPPGADDGFETACRAVAEHGAAADPEVPGSLRAGDLIEVLHRREH